MKAVTFTNFTDKPFVGRWDGEDYPFAPGQTGIYKDGQAKVFARQLAVEQCIADKDDFLNGVQGYMAKALPSDEAVVEGKESKVESEIMNFNAMKVAELKEVAEEKGIETKGNRS